MKHLLLTALLIGIAALALGGLVPQAVVFAAGDARYPVEGSFSASVPVIPGYNAPYPDLAQAQMLESTVAQGSTVARVGFAATAPQIPGYNVPYPEFGLAR